MTKNGGRPFDTTQAMPPIVGHDRNQGVPGQVARLARIEHVPADDVTNRLFEALNIALI